LFADKINAVNDVCPLLLLQLREALAEKEDLTVQNSLLQKRLDKSKTTTSRERGSFAK